MDARQKTELLAATLDSRQAKPLLEEFSSKEPVEYRTLQERLFYYGDDGLHHHLNVLLNHDIVIPGPYLKGESTYVANEEFDVDGKAAIDIVIDGIKAEDARWREQLGPIRVRTHDIELMMKHVNPMVALVQYPIPYEVFTKLPGMNNYTNRLELDDRYMLEFSTEYDNHTTTHMADLSSNARSMMLKIFDYDELRAHREEFLK